MFKKMIKIMIEDILETPDEEIIKEAVEDNINIEEEVLRIKSIFNKCLDNSEKRFEKNLK